MASIIYLSSICRLCLNTDAKEKETGMFEITEIIQNKFQAIAQQDLILSDEYPRKVCGECCDNLENFTFYKNLLLKKQTQLVEFLKCKNILKTKALDVEYLDEAVEFIKIETVNENFIDESGDVGVTFEKKHPEKQSVIKKELITPKIEPIDIVGSIIEDSIEIDDDFNMPEMEFADYAEEIAGHRPHIILHPSYLEKLEKNKNAQSSNKLLGTSSISPMKTTDSTTFQSFYPFKCLKCGIIYENQLELDHHMIDHLFEEGPQKCQKCSTIFKTATHYKRHIQKDHKGQKYICNVCGNLYLTQRKLTSHLRTHNLTKKFACTFDDCTKAFRLKLHLQNHERTHTGERPFVCKQPDCNASFKQSYMLTLHTRRHEGIVYACEKCQSEYFSSFALKKHERQCTGLRNKRKTFRKQKRLLTNDDQFFKCAVEDCAAKYRSKISLQKHVISAHDMEVTDKTCIICLMDFEDSRALRLHNQEHFPYSCLECSMRFTSAEIMKKHEDNYHTETRPYKCTLCYSSFKRPEHLKIHTAYRHSNNRPFKCDLCDYSAPFRWDLADHFKTTHSNIRPHQCRFCDFAAKKVNYLRYHMKKIHESIEVYTCDQCEETFEYCDQLNEHKKNHTIFEQLY